MCTAMRAAYTMIDIGGKFETAQHFICNDLAGDTFFDRM